MENDTDKYVTESMLESRFSFYFNLLTGEVVKHVTTLRDDMNRGMDAINAHLVLHDQKLDHITEILVDHTERHISHDEKFEVIDSKFKAIDVRFDSVDTRFNSIDEKLNDISLNLRIVKNDVEMVKSDTRLIKDTLAKKVNYEEFITLEKRTTVLEEIAEK